MYVQDASGSREIMPPKPKKKDEMERVYMRAPASWLARINAYRRSQPDLPNVSEAIRRLVELGMEKGKRK
jgi:hypothetical protein